MFDCELDEEKFFIKKKYRFCRSKYSIMSNITLINTKNIIKIFKSNAKWFTNQLTVRIAIESNFVVEYK